MERNGCPLWAEYALTTVPYSFPSTARLRFPLLLALLRGPVFLLRAPSPPARRRQPAGGVAVPLLWYHRPERLLAALQKAETWSRTAKACAS